MALEEQWEIKDAKSITPFGRMVLYFWKIREIDNKRRTETKFACTNFSNIPHSQQKAISYAIDSLK